MVKVKKKSSTSSFEKNYLAVDYGTKVTGTALYLEDKSPYPMPYERIIYKSEEQLIQEISKLVENECIDIVILGIPHLTDGGETESTKKIKSFGEMLRLALKQEIIFQDETLTTFEAKDRMKNSPKYNFKINLKKIDCLSASIILEDYLKNIKKSS